MKKMVWIGMFGVLAAAKAASVQSHENMLITNVVKAAEDTRILTLTSENFQSEVLEKKGMLLIDVTAEWCVNCHLMEPEYKAVADEYADEIRFADIDGEVYISCLQDYKVEGYPTLLFFQDGEYVGKIVGYHDFEGIEDALVSIFNIKRHEKSEQMPDTPLETKSPALTESPVPTQSPALTESPVPTQSPALTESPVPTQSPALTESPVPTETAKPQPIKINKVKIKQKKRIAKKQAKIVFDSLKNVTGYEITYADNNKFSKKKTLYTKKNTVVLKKLNSKKSYYIKVRGYYQEKGKKKQYGTYSKVVKVKPY